MRTRRLIVFVGGAGIRHDTAGTVPAVRYLADFERPRPRSAPPASLGHLAYRLSRTLRNRIVRPFHGIPCASSKKGRPPVDRTDDLLTATGHDCLDCRPECGATCTDAPR